MTRRYIDMDSTTNIATEYERTGECNQCGDCCKAHIQLSENSNLPSMVHADGIPSTTNHEIDANGKPTNKILERPPIQTQITVDEIQYSHALIGIDTSWKRQCPQLNNNNKCMQYESKSILCEEWPMSPQHVKPFKNCSYKFTEIDNWEFEYVDSVV